MDTKAVMHITLTNEEKNEFLWLLEYASKHAVHKRDIIELGRIRGSIKDNEVNLDEEDKLLLSKCILMWKEIMIMERPESGKLVMDLEWVLG